MNAILFLEAPILDVKLSSKSVALSGFAPDHIFSQYKIKHWAKLSGQKAAIILAQTELCHPKNFCS